MAVGAWTLYNSAKEYIADGSIDLDDNIFRVTLHTSASNAATATISVIGSVDNQIADGNGYSTSGKTLSATTWTTGASAGQMKFDSTAIFWSANGGNIANIKFAVVWKSGASAGARKVLCYSQLSTSQFTLTTGNRITVTPNANGIFTLA